METIPVDRSAGGEDADYFGLGVDFVLGGENGLHAEPGELRVESVGGMGEFQVTLDEFQR